MWAKTLYNIFGVGACLWLGNTSVDEGAGSWVGVFTPALWLCLACAGVWKPATSDDLPVLADLVLGREVIEHLFPRVVVDGKNSVFEQSYSVRQCQTQHSAAAHVRA